METRKKKSFKRLFAFLMAFVMVTTLAVSAVFAADPTFKDVPKDYEFYDEIEDLAAKKIVSGYGDTGLFKPEEKLTRAQAAKMIAGAAGIKVSKGFETAFTDVDEDVDMYEYIWALEEAKIVKGWGTTKEFRPNEEIERGHVAKMVALAFGLAEGDLDVEFKDLPADKEVADAIMALATNDIVKGYGSTGEFRPEEPVLRGQFAKMVSRAMNLELKIVEAKAVNSETVVVEFNKDLGAIKAANFMIKEKVTGSIQVISKVAAKEKVATITLATALVDKKTYILEATDVEAKAGAGLTSGEAEFDYLKADPLSIEFVATTVKKGASVKYLVKDENGNDVTNDYPISKLDVEVSDSTVIKVSDLEALKVGFATVNLRIKDTEIETGNTIIEVKDTLEVLTSIGRWTLTDDVIDYKKPITELFVKDIDLYSVKAEVLNQDGEVYTGGGETMSFASNSPAVLVVHETSGLVTPIAVGSANITISAKVGTKTVSKTVTVKVKANPKATKLVVDPTSVTLVKLIEGKGGLTETVEVKVLDQYDKKFEISGNVTFKINKDNISGSIAKDTATAATRYTALGVAEIDLVAGAADPGTATLTVTYEAGTIKLTDTVSIALVNPGSLKGYLVETPDGTDIDRYANVAGHDKDLLKGVKEAVVKVYEVDANGNKLDALVATTGFTLEAVTPPASIVTIAGDKVSVLDDDDKVGKQAIQVKVGTVVVKTLNFEVFDSTPVLDSVKRMKSAVSLAVDATLGLFVESDPVFVGYDQYGDKFAIDAGDYDAISSNPSVFAADTLKALAAGTATVTFVFDTGDIHVLTVIVPAAG